MMVRSFQITIDVLGLSRRAYNCLRRVGIDTVDQIVGLSDKQLLAIPRLGDLVLAEIRVKLEAYLANHPPLERPGPANAPQEKTRVQSPGFTSNQTPLYALGLSTATQDLLEQAGIVTIGRLIRMPLGQYVSTKGYTVRPGKRLKRRSKRIWQNTLWRCQSRSFLWLIQSF